MSHWLHTGVRWFWVICAALLISAAVLVQLGRSFSFVLADYRDQLAESWSQQLAMPVSIGDLSMDWSGLSPELVVGNLELETTSGEPVLAIAEAQVEVQVLTSLLEWRLVLGHVGFRRIELGFVQDDQGQWNIPGLKLTGKRADDSVVNPFQAFLIGQRVDLNDAVINLTWANGKQLSLEIPEVRLENKQDFHRLVVRLDIDGMPDVVTAIVEGHGHPADRDNFRARGYLNINQLALERPLALLIKQLTGNVPEDLNSQALASLELWWDYDGSRWHTQGSAGLSGGWPTALPEQISPVHSIDVSFDGYLARTGDWQVDVRDLHSAWGAQITEPLSFRLAAQADQALMLQMASLDLDYQMALWRANTNYRNKLSEILGTLNVAGRIENIELKVPLDKPLDYRLTANIDSLSNNRWMGVPGLTGIDGYVYADARGGYLELDSQRGMSMLYSIYDQPMQYDRALGTVAWHLRKDDNSIFINSSELYFQGRDGTAIGHFIVDLPWQKDSRASEMVLQVGLQGSRAEYYDIYVPKTVPQTVRSWLKRSVGNGEVKDAGFVYRGSLRPGDSENRTVQLYLDIANTDLDYHPDWPAIGNIEAQLLMDDIDIDVQVSQASLLRSSLSNTEVAVIEDPVNGGLMLNINTQVKGPLSDGLDILRNSPVREVLGEGLDSWQVRGAMDAQLELDVPLTPGATNGRQKVVARVEQSQLLMGDINLSFDNLSGLLRYQTGQGLSSQNLKASLWGQPLSAQITSKAGSQGYTQIRAKGHSRWQAVRDWSRIPELGFIEGTFPYTATVKLPAGSGPEIQIETDLLGSLIDLPAPFGKTAETEKNLTFDLLLQGKNLDYQIDFDDLAQMDIQQRPSGIASMQLLLTSDGQHSIPVIAPVDGEFSVVGSADNFELNQWLNVFDRHSAFAEAARFEKLLEQSEALDETAPEDQSLDAQSEPEASVEPVMEPLPELTTRLNVRLDRAAVGDIGLENLKVAGRGLGQDWRFQLQHPEIAGQVLLSADKPLALNLEYLHFLVPDSELPQSNEAQSNQAQTNEVQATPEPEPLAVSEPPAEPQERPEPVDPLAGFDPSDLVAMDVFIDSLKWGEDDWGRWRFQVRPVDAGVELRQLKAQTKYLELTAQSDVSDYAKRPGTQLFWRLDEQGQPYTQIAGQFKGGNIGDTLQAFQQEPLMESKSADFKFDWHWQGSPLALDLYKLDGQLDVELTKGRFISDAGGSTEVMKLLGILNFDTWMRRLQLDFGDLYKSGLVFNELTGDLRFEQGMLYLDTPLVMRSPSSSIQLSGLINLEDELLDTRLVATLPVVGNLTLITALTAGLPAAAGVYLVSKLFEEQIDKASSLTYSMKGTWTEPELSFEKMFDRSEPKATDQSSAAQSSQPAVVDDSSAMPAP